MTKETDMVDLIERRKAKKLTQEELAKQLEVSTTTLKKWEHRRGNITKSHLLKYARMLNMNPMTIIDPFKKFKHYDSKKYSFDGKPNLRSILSMCFELVPRRITKVFRYVSRQLDEQTHTRVTYNDLLKNITHHDLLIDGEVVNDEDITLFRTEDKKTEDFFGSVPDDYVKSLKIVNDELFPLFKKNQRIFLSKATNHISSGSFVVATRDEEIRIFQYRATYGNIYLFPLENRKEGIDTKNPHEEYLWKNHPSWNIEYVIII